MNMRILHDVVRWSSLAIMISVGVAIGWKFVARGHGEESAERERHQLIASALRAEKAQSRNSA